MTPHDDVTISIEGPACYGFHVVTDALGMSLGTSGVPMPSGSYRFSASDGHGVLVALPLSVRSPGVPGLHGCG